MYITYNYIYIYIILHCIIYIYIILHIIYIFHAYENWNKHLQKHLFCLLNWKIEERLRASSEGTGSKLLGHLKWL